MAILSSCDGTRTCEQASGGLPEEYMQTGSACEYGRVLICGPFHRLRATSHRCARVIIIARSLFWEEFKRMGPLGYPEMIFIFFLALILFGPKKLPELGRTVGKALTEFRRASNELKSTFDREMKNLEQ